MQVGRCETVRQGYASVLQDVVVLGGGAFACEAMREAVRNGARSVTTVTRHNAKCAGMISLGSVFPGCRQSLTFTRSAGTASPHIYAPYACACISRRTSQAS